MDRERFERLLKDCELAAVDFGEYVGDYDDQGFDPEDARLEAVLATRHDAVMAAFDAITRSSS